MRLFILSDSPPEKDVQWSDEGMNSSFKFIQKLWVLNQKILDEIDLDHSKNSNNNLEKITNKFIYDVQKNIENFSYNKIIANFHEVYSALNKVLNDKLDKINWCKNYSNILITMCPVIPHFVNECLEMLDQKGYKKEFIWPQIDKGLLKSDKINFVIQINGKTRGILNLAINIKEKELLDKVKEDPKIGNHLKNKEFKKTIFIPNKLINIII